MSLVEYSPYGLTRTLRRRPPSPVHPLGVDQYFEWLPDALVVYIISLLEARDICALSSLSSRLNSLCWTPMLWNCVSLQSSVNAESAICNITSRLCRETPYTCLTLEKIVVQRNCRLTQHALMTIAQTCSQLRHLQVPHCINVTSRGVSQVISRCPNLEYLDVSGCAALTRITLVAESSPSTFANSPEAYLVELQNKCLSLQYLDISDCGFSDSGLASLWPACRNLRVLYMRRCRRLTDQTMDLVSKYCPNLREISASDCPKISTVFSHIEPASSRSLKYISLAHCTLVNDQSIRVIAKSCGHKLRYLNVRGCELLTDHTMQTLAKSCNKLGSVDISKCINISDAGISVLILNCVQLKRLSIRGCTRLTDRTLQVISQCCQKLQYLDMQHCPDFSRSAYRAFKTSCTACIVQHTNPSFIAL